MTFDFYTISMIVSGLALIWVALEVGRNPDGPDPLARQKGDLVGGRGLYVGIGALFTAYGLFVAAQDSGTWPVPVILLLLPWGLAAWLYFAKKVTPQRPPADPPER